jgi:hypothetical protein
MSFGFEQTGDVAERAAALRAEIADVHGLAVLVDAGGARDQQDHQAVEVDTHAADERTRLTVVVGFVENVEIGDRPLLNGSVRDGFEDFLYLHMKAPYFCLIP